MTARLSILLGIVLLGIVNNATAAELIFERSANRLTLKNAKGQVVGSWTACNNVVQGAKPYPAGTWSFGYHKRHDDDAPNSAFGSHGNLVFSVTGRTGMGVHAGRASAANRPGPQHPTHGCIRTTDQAMQAIVSHHGKDALKSLTVK